MTSKIPGLENILKMCGDLRILTFGKAESPFEDDAIMRPSTIDNYYQRLGLEDFADISEVRPAYTRQALVLHPDRNPRYTKEAEREFKSVHESYETLRDPRKKASYDQKLRQRIRRKSSKKDRTHSSSRKIVPIGKNEISRLRSVFDNPNNIRLFAALNKYDSGSERIYENGSFDQYRGIINKEAFQFEGQSFDSLCKLADQGLVKPISLFEIGPFGAYADMDFTRVISYVLTPLCKALLSKREETIRGDPVLLEAYQEGMCYQRTYDLRGLMRAFNSAKDKKEWVTSVDESAFLEPAIPANF